MTGPRLAATFPATLEALEAFCQAVRSRAAEVVPPQGPDAFAIEMLVREAVTNAVLHGSRKDPAKQVRCTFTVGASRCSLRVTDQGPGFDWRAGLDRCADPDRPGGRGMELYRLYAHRTLFNRQGNSLLLVRNFQGAKP